MFISLFAGQTTKNSLFKVLTEFALSLFCQKYIQDWLLRRISDYRLNISESITIFNE